jgi:hypothetical protein
MKGTIMKHRNIFSIALILGALLWPLSFTSTEAQPNGRSLILDTGVIRLPASQTLRLTVNGQAGHDNLTVRFRRMYYIGSNNGGIWRNSLVADNTSAPVTLTAGEALSIDTTNSGFDAVRLEATIRGYTGATNVNAGVAQIVNSNGEVVAFIDNITWDPNCPSGCTFR